MLNIKNKQENIIRNEDNIMERWRQARNRSTIDEEEKEKSLKKIKLVKATGKDNIIPEMIKQMG